MLVSAASSALVQLMGTSPVGETVGQETNERGSSSFSPPRVCESARHPAGLTLSCADGFPFLTLRTGQRRCRAARRVKPLGKAAKEEVAKLCCASEK